MDIRFPVRSLLHGLLANRLGKQHHVMGFTSKLRVALTFKFVGKKSLQEIKLAFGELGLCAGEG